MHYEGAPLQKHVFYCDRYDSTVKSSQRAIPFSGHVALTNLLTLLTFTTNITNAEILSVCPFVCPENNWFLRLVYEPRTRARGYWDFENMILTAPEKTSHKVKLRLKVGTLGDQFLNTFGRSFLKNIIKTCRSELSCQRPGNDQQMSGRLCDVPTTFPEVTFLMALPGPALRASLPCRV